ncbi:MAG: hypothetical protein QOG89_3581, partial [Thermomicrobiales bacterium]|nr:hypothetical protein [Thermomicrobiales bacterium]
ETLQQRVMADGGADETGGTGQHECFAELLCRAIVALAARAAPS